MPRSNLTAGASGCQLTGNRAVGRRPGRLVGKRTRRRSSRGRLVKRHVATTTAASYDPYRPCSVTRAYRVRVTAVWRDRRGLDTSCIDVLVCRTSIDVSERVRVPGTAALPTSVPVGLLIARCPREEHPLYNQCELRPRLHATVVRARLATAAAPAHRRRRHRSHRLRGAAVVEVGHGRGHAGL